MSVRPIQETLARLQGGLFLSECSDKLAECVRGVDETGKAGKLTITLDLKKSAGAIEIVAKVTNKTPEPRPDSDLLWPAIEAKRAAAWSGPEPDPVDSDGGEPDARPGFLAQIDACRRDVAQWPEWMRATTSAPKWMEGWDD